MRVKTREQRVPLFHTPNISQFYPLPCNNYIAELLCSTQSFSSFLNENYRVFLATVLYYPFQGTSSSQRLLTARYRLKI